MVSRIKFINLIKLSRHFKRTNGKREGARSVAILFLYIRQHSGFYRFLLSSGCSYCGCSVLAFVMPPPSARSSSRRGVGVHLINMSCRRETVFSFAWRGEEKSIKSFPIIKAGSRALFYWSSSCSTTPACCGLLSLSRRTFRTGNVATLLADELRSPR